MLGTSRVPRAGHWGRLQLPQGRGTRRFASEKLKPGFHGEAEWGWDVLTPGSRVSPLRLRGLAISGASQVLGERPCSF